MCWMKISSNGAIPKRIKYSSRTPISWEASSTPSSPTWELTVLYEHTQSSRTIWVFLESSTSPTCYQLSTSSSMPRTPPWEPRLRSASYCMPSTLSTYPQPSLNSCSFASKLLVIQEEILQNLQVSLQIEVKQRVFMHELSLNSVHSYFFSSSLSHFLSKYPVYDCPIRDHHGSSCWLHSRFFLHLLVPMLGSSKMHIWPEIDIRF